MEEQKFKTSVLRKAFSSLSTFVRILPQNDNDNNEIEDIDDLGKFSEEERATIEEIRKVEAQLKKAAANAGSKKGLQRTLWGNEITREGRTTVMKTVINNERDEKIRG